MVNFSPVNRVAGLISGLETQKIIEDLMKAARVPLNRLLQQKQILQWQQEDYRSINKKLMDFRLNYASPLRLQGTFQVKKATSSDETAVTAVPGGSAQPGTYSIKVNQLAEVASNVSTLALSASTTDKIDPNATLESQKAKFARPWGATTSLSFTITTYNPDGTPNSKTFTVDTTVDTLNTVLARINAEASLGVTAFYDASTDKVVISTTRTGDYPTIEIEIADVVDTFALGTLALSSTAQGKNAIVDINGLTGITKYENTFTLNNITFTLKKTTASPVLISVGTDTEKIFNTVKSFVEEFNALLDAIKQELNEPRYADYLPLTKEQKEQLTDREIDQWEEKARSGLLRNDTILSDIVYRLRRALTTPVTGLTGYDSLFDIGVRTGYYWEGGKLYVDEAKLREAINANPEAVMNLFTRSAENFEEQGLGVRLYNEVNKAINRVTAQAGSPYTLVDNSFLSRNIRELDERIETMEERLARLEERYWRQFTALEQVLATLQAQSNWLAGIAGQAGSTK